MNFILARVVQFFGSEQLKGFEDVYSSSQDIGLRAGELTVTV